VSENYDKLKRPPASALRTIKGGRINGMTDIKPQWRYEVMDSVYGPCGEKWKYEIVRLWLEAGSKEQQAAFAQINVYVKAGDKWSDPIPGVGGSMFVELESKGLYTNDEAYKMAITDALSTALKMLGVAADIHMGMWDGTKYKDDPTAGKEAPPNYDASEYIKLKEALIDYLNIEPPIFEHPGKVNAVIDAKDIVNMRKAIEAAKKKNAERLGG
jgi:hypothetical protein